MTAKQHFDQGVPMVNFLILPASSCVASRTHYESRRGVARLPGVGPGCRYVFICFSSRADLEVMARAHPTGERINPARAAHLPGRRYVKSVDPNATARSCAWLKKPEIFPRSNPPEATAVFIM